MKKLSLFIFFIGLGMLFTSKVQAACVVSYVQEPYACGTWVYNGCELPDGSLCDYGQPLCECDRTCSPVTGPHCSSSCNIDCVPYVGPEACNMGYTCTYIPDPVYPTSTPRPINTPVPGCTCGDCNQCAAPGTYPDSCGNPGACPCCGGGGSCPSGVCCWPGLCNGEISTGNAYCDPFGASLCCNSCIPVENTGRLRMWAFYDSNRNGRFDVADGTFPESLKSSTARFRVFINGNTLEWPFQQNLTDDWRAVEGQNIEDSCRGRGGNWDDCGGDCSRIIGDTNYLPCNKVKCDYNASFFKTDEGVCDGNTGKAYVANWIADPFFQWHPFWGYFNEGLSKLVSFNMEERAIGGGGINMSVENLPSQYKVTVMKFQHPQEVNTQRTVYGDELAATIPASGGNEIRTGLVVIGIGPTDPPVNNPPTFGVLNISDIDDDFVTADGSGRNHICEDEFRLSSNSRVVRFWATVNDADGAADITTISLRFNNGSGEYMSVSMNNLDTTPSWGPLSGGVGNATVVGSPIAYTSGNNRIAVFAINFNSSFISYLYDMDVSASDGVNTLPWTDANRDFKVWDCQVPVSGSLYDAGGNSGVCTLEMYTNLVSDEVSFTDLDMGSQQMIVTSPNYVDGGNHLTWGQTYVPDFNDDLNAGSPLTSIRVTDPSDTSVDCRSGTVLIDEDNFDPYASSIEADVDFSATQNQDPWWQGRGVSILGRTGVTSEVPATCAVVGVGCTPALTIDWDGQQNNGVVMSNDLGPAAGDWGYSDNWYKDDHIQNNLPSLTYGDIHSELFDDKGVGREASGWTGVIGVGGTGLVFVTGPLTITSDHIVAPGGFLMVVVNGNITINENVTRLDGAYVASGGQILIGGENDTALTINGMLYATNNIESTRGFITNASNNLNPAVVVDMRPDLIFNAPSYMFDNRTRL